MAGFLSAVDIANRACDHVGVPHISALTDNNKQAGLILSCFDKLRQAELRRNVWRFATRRALLYPFQPGMLLLAPGAWFAGTTYSVGQIVKDAAGTLWESQWNNNLGNAPGVALAGQGGVQPWIEYFGPPMVTPWSAAPNTFQSSAYFAGDLVYVQYFNGQVLVYKSLASDNTANPGVLPTWSSAEIYYLNQIVLGSDGFFYMNLWQVNIGQDPTNWAGVLWNAFTTYAATNVVADPADGKLYASLANGNLGQIPHLNPGLWYYTGGTLPWTPAFSQSVTAFATNWAVQPNANEVSQPYIVYPLGSGPSTQSASRNIFQLPVGYLREAPQDPKAGSVQFLGAPSGLGYNDWEFEGDYLVSRCATPLPFRFVADTADVANMDPMFCEGLGCRVAMAICEPLTQSSEKLGRIGQEYQKFMTEARLVNGIETKPVEAAEDSYILCRV